MVVVLDDEDSAVEMVPPVEPLASVPLLLPAREKVCSELGNAFAIANTLPDPVELVRR